MNSDSVETLLVTLAPKLEARLKDRGYMVKSSPENTFSIVKIPPPPPPPPKPKPPEPARRSEILGEGDYKCRYSIKSSYDPFPMELQQWREESLRLDLFRKEPGLIERLILKFRERQEGFSRTLLRMIRKRGFKETDVYLAAGIDKRHFAKIRKDAYYKPSRKTVLAFAFALHLNRKEVDHLMQTAGMALSKSDPFDILIAFFIQEGIYDLITIDQILAHYNQPLLLQHREVGE